MWNFINVKTQFALLMLKIYRKIRCHRTPRGIFFQARFSREARGHLKISMKPFTKIPLSVSWTPSLLTKIECEKLRSGECDNTVNYGRVVWSAKIRYHDNNPNPVPPSPGSQKTRPWKNKPSSNCWKRLETAEPGSRAHPLKIYQENSPRFRVQLREKRTSGSTA